MTFDRDQKLAQITDLLGLDQTRFEVQETIDAIPFTSGPRADAQGPEWGLQLDAVGEIGGRTTEIDLEGPLEIGPHRNHQRTVTLPSRHHAGGPSEPAGKDLDAPTAVERATRHNAIDLQDGWVTPGDQLELGFASELSTWKLFLEPTCESLRVAAARKTGSTAIRGLPGFFDSDGKLHIPFLAWQQDEMRPGEAAADHRCGLGSALRAVDHQDERVLVHCRRRKGGVTGCGAVQPQVILGQIGDGVVKG